MFFKKVKGGWGVEKLSKLWGGLMGKRGRVFFWGAGGKELQFLSDPKKHEFKQKVKFIFIY